MPTIETLAIVTSDFVSFNDDDDDDDDDNDLMITVLSCC